MKDRFSEQPKRKRSPFFHDHNKRKGTSGVPVPEDVHSYFLPCARGYELALLAGEVLIITNWLIISAGGIR
jgi:hypothetical protein